MHIIVTCSVTFVILNSLPSFQGDDEKEVSIAEIRSISTPNLKRAAALSAVASPYQTFESSPYENLDNGDENCEEMTATAASPSVEGNGYITSSSEDGSTGTGRCDH